MKKIKYFVLAFAGTFLAAGFTGCKDDDEKIVEKVI